MYIINKIIRIIFLQETEMTLSQLMPTEDVKLLYMSKYAEAPRWTTVHHLLRKELGLSNSEYAVIDSIHHLNQSRGTRGFSKEEIGSFLKIGDRSVYRAVSKGIEKEILRRDERGNVWTTEQWIHGISLARSGELTSSPEGEILGPRFTTILHPIRIHLQLSTNEYCVIDSIHQLSTSSTDFAYCVQSKREIGEFLNLSERTVFKAIQEGTRKKLLESAAKGQLRTTDEWRKWLFVFRKERRGANTA